MTGFLANTDFLTSQENALAHFQIVARASCPCYLKIFRGGAPHATKNVPTHFPKNSPNPLSRSGSLKYRDVADPFPSRGAPIRVLTFFGGTLVLLL